MGRVHNSRFSILCKLSYISLDVAKWTKRQFIISAVTLKKYISFYTLPSNRYACFCAKYEQCPQWSISVRLDQLLVGHLPLPQIYSPKHFNFHMNLCKHSWVTTVWQVHKSIFSSVCKLEKSYVGGAKWSLKLVFFNLAPSPMCDHTWNFAYDLRLSCICISCFVRISTSTHELQLFE